ncbi:DUF257 family protein [Thermococcus sp. 2319x1]|uniref:DUF257 family protein n=1 Tax=Thermococcus sp. 2319x1 TaxID=1674923 RepID=UPI001E4EA1CE|nr:DUF257 family protein [Thermococcus sp. 2319x1]
MKALKFKNIWEFPKFGETVLLEYPSSALPYRELVELITWGKENKIPVVMDDILDTLYVYKTHMELAGIDTGILEDVRVIKTGGRLEVGNVIKRFRVSDIMSLIQEFEENYEALLSEMEHAIVPVLGIERLFLLADSKIEALALINMLTRYAGSRRRTAFYFTNVDVLRNSVPYVLPLLEELATTVLQIHRKGEEIIPEVKKSISMEVKV